MFLILVNFSSRWTKKKQKNAWNYKKILFEKKNVYFFYFNVLQKTLLIIFLVYLETNLILKRISFGLVQ